MNSGFVDRNYPLSGENAGARGDSPANPRLSVTVSELNRAVADRLTKSFPLVTVRGEISNLTRASSGHCYFSLKDPGAQVRCVMFRQRAVMLGFELREGLKVELRATVSLYEPRGDFQLNVEAMRQAGSGDLFQAFLELKAKLQAEGLFDPANKRAMPEDIQTVGVVTSLQAAALRDVLATLRQRNPQLKVVIYPALVQGAEAPLALARAIRAASVRHEVDVLLIVRGGGSMEDLWAFNDERLARLIAQCPMPTVSGVGHETDFTICDFVADMRAATPTAAASAVAIDQRERWRQLHSMARSLHQAMQRYWSQSSQRLDLVARLLRSPRESLAADRARLTWLAQGLSRAWQQKLSGLQQKLAASAQQLHLISPLAVLERGYVLVSDPATGKLIRSAGAAQKAPQLLVKFADGEVLTVPTEFGARATDPAR